MSNASHQGPQPWLSEVGAARVADIQQQHRGFTSADYVTEIERLAQENLDIHDRQSINLNPAANVMNPRAEALLASGMGSRPSLGEPGVKHEMGLEAIEQLEVIAQDLVTEVFNANFAELRVASGQLANLYTFMAAAKPGDTIIAPVARQGGHISHLDASTAGLYGLTSLPLPVQADGWTIDLPALRSLVQEQRPKLIVLGGSLNFAPLPIAQVREIADTVGALVLFDAAHVCGLFAGKAWPNPLDEGAHVMTFSTYKSLAGPPGGAIVLNDAALAERLAQIAYPGMTSNFDVAKVASLALTMTDWLACGQEYATAMLELAQVLAAELTQAGLPVFTLDGVATLSHQLALQAHQWGGGRSAAVRLRQANLLASGIQLPIEPVSGDSNGLRMGTPELVRIGMTPAHMPTLAGLIARGLDPTEEAARVAAEVSQWRQEFTTLHYLV